MGSDKGLLDYHGVSQRDYLYKLLEEVFLSKNNKVYLSIGKEQELTQNTIVDAFVDLGPFGGICSAFQKDPNSAWLVIATDLPFVDKSVIELLVKHRNPSKIATTLKGKNQRISRAFNYYLGTKSVSCFIELFIARLFVSEKSTHKFGC